MLRFKCISFAAVAAIAVLCGTQAQASSILIDQGNATYDPGTNLQWLDLTATQGLTYNNILNNVGVNYVADGWHFATDVQVDQLFRDGGLPLASNPNGTFFYTSNPGVPGYATIEHDAFTLGSELGWTLPSGTDYFTTGIFDIAPNPRNPSTIGLTTLDILGYLQDDGLGRSTDVNEFLDTVNKDEAVRNIASFLVRDVPAVPIPGQAVTLAAVLLGLAGVNLWRRKQLS